MQNFKEAGFIKSYPALLKLPITVSEKSLMELVLSFTDNKNTFYMNYKDIAPYLGFGNVQSVKNVIFSLRKKGYIITKQSHNFNGSTGGSSTSIGVNEMLINLQLKVIDDKESEAIRNNLNDDFKHIESIVAERKINDEAEAQELLAIKDNQISPAKLKQKDSDSEYSGVEFQLANKTIVFVKKDLVEYWDVVMLKTKVIDNLRKSSSQYMFDFDLKDRIEKLKNEKLLMDKYYSKST